MEIPLELQELLPALRAKHKNIYVIDISRFDMNKLCPFLVVRPMTRAEFNSFTDNFLRHPICAVNYLIDTIVVYKKYALDTYLAGIDEYICKAVSDISGFSSMGSLVTSLDKYRKMAQTLESAVTIYICKAFPSLTPEDVDNMTMEDQIRYVTLAELLLSKELPFADFFSPKKKKKDKGKRIVDQVMSRQENQPLPPPRKGTRSFQSEKQEEHTHVVVTPDNLKEIMKETREIFTAK